MHDNLHTRVLQAARKWHFSQPTSFDGGYSLQIVVRQQVRYEYNARRVNFSFLYPLEGTSSAILILVAVFLTFIHLRVVKYS